MLEFLDLPDLNIVGIHLSDTLTQEDLDELEAELQNKLENHTTARVFFEIDDVEGWEPEDAWEEMALDIRLVQDVDKVAVVGEEVWDPLMDKIDLLFPMSLIQTYEDDDREEALEWIRGDMDVPGIGPGSVPDPQAGAQDVDEE